MQVYNINVIYTCHINCFELPKLHYNLFIYAFLKHFVMYLFNYQTVPFLKLSTLQFSQRVFVVNLSARYHILLSTHLSWLVI